MRGTQVDTEKGEKNTNRKKQRDRDKQTEKDQKLTEKKRDGQTERRETEIDRQIKRETGTERHRKGAV